MDEKVRCRCVNAWRRLHHPWQHPGSGRLVENLFMDNYEDCAFLLSPEGQQAIVNLYVDGICAYLAE